MLTPDGTAAITLISLIIVLISLLIVIIKERTMAATLVPVRVKCNRK